MTYSMTGNSRGPLIVLDKYEAGGIRLICRSEEIQSPELQLLWMDGKGQELATAPTTTLAGNATPASSLLLEPGSGNAVSCRLVSVSTKISTGTTSLVIADVFFPSTPPLMIAFFMIAVLSVAVVIATYFKLKQNRWKKALTENNRKALEDEKSQLQAVLAKEKNASQTALEEKQKPVEKAMTELEFRRAYCYAVNVMLDPKCIHPKLKIHQENRLGLDQSSQKEKVHQGTVIAVANEGFSSEKWYWEVEVGEKPDWELGVLTETARDRLAKEKLKIILEEGCVGMRWFQGKYHCTGGSSLIDNQNAKCAVVGVFLDMEEKMLSFYDVQLMCPIRSIPVAFTEKMYPFFNPGKDKEYLGIRPLSTSHV